LATPIYELKLLLVVTQTLNFGYCKISATRTNKQSSTERTRNSANNPNSPK